MTITDVARIVISDWEEAGWRNLQTIIYKWADYYSLPHQALKDAVEAVSR